MSIPSGLRSTFFAVLLLVSSAGSWAAVKEWSQVQKLTGEGRYAEAIEILKSHPSEDSTYFYNLGTMHAKLGDHGPAVAYLEKANRKRPRDAEIRQQLDLVRGALRSRIGSDRLDPASTWVEALADEVPITEVRGALGLLVFVLSLLWCRSYLRNHSLLKTFTQPAGMIGLTCLTITLGLYTAERIAASHPVAVSLERQVVRSGPGPEYMELGKVEAGTKVRAMGPTAADASGPEGAASGKALWRQVRYSSSSIGWLPSSSLLLL